MAAINASFLGTLSTRRSSVVVGSFTTRHCRLSGISIFVGYAPGPYPSSQGVRAVTKKISPHAAADSKNSINSASLMDDDQDPKPIVIIDQDSEPGETVLILSFGERLGALIDTIRALKDLGLNVVKGSVQTDGPTKQTTLHITVLSTGRKVEDPDMLERIRLTVINNLLKFHPESSEQLAMGEAFGVKAPVKKPVSDVATRIYIQDDGPKRSLLCIEMADRSGLLLEIIKNIADMNLEVESAEIDTEGLVAKNKFHVSYHGAALKNDMARGLVNCLRYYLRRPQTDEDSY